MNLEEFFSDVLPKHASQQPNNISLLLIDECANHPAVRAVAGQAVRENIVVASIPLWDQLRQKSDGTFLHLTGTPIRGALPPGEEYGLPVKSYSFKDEQIIESAVFRFITGDRLILVTEDTRGNRGGIRSLLQNNVESLLKAHHGNRFELLAFMKKGKTSWNIYADKLIDRLRLRVNAGFECTIV